MLLSLTFFAAAAAGFMAWASVGAPKPLGVAARVSDATLEADAAYAAAANNL